MANKSKDFVYFIQGDVTERIKIGQTGNIPQRLSELNTGSEPLTLLGYVFSSVYTEKVLHRKFAAHRVHSEWFAPNPEVLQFIDSKCIGGMPAPIYKLDDGKFRFEFPVPTHPTLNFLLKCEVRNLIAFGGKHAPHIIGVDGFPRDILSLLEVSGVKRTVLVNIASAMNVTNYQ